MRKIQSILKSLHDTGQSIPRKYIIDFSKKDLAVSRTGASLYLMLYQVSNQIASVLNGSDTTPGSHPLYSAAHPAKGQGQGGQLAAV